MKKLITAALIAFSATSFGQGHVYNGPQTFNGTLTQNGAAAFNSTAKVTKLITAVESDSARSYTFTGKYVCKVKWLVRDTVSLATSTYSANSLYKFIVVATGADTTVFVPTTGTINGAATLVLTGTNNSVSIFFDGTNYWSVK